MFKRVTLQHASPSWLFLLIIRKEQYVPKKVIKRVLEYANRLLKYVAKQEAWQKKNPNKYPKLLISSNKKTGFSFNREVSSCTGATEECKNYCYRFSGHFVYSNVSEKLWQVENYIRDHSAEQIAKRIDSELPRAVKNFRWNGVGDLCGKTTRAINIMCELRPEMQQYVYTKNLSLAIQINKKVAINFSIDRSTPKHIVDKILNGSRYDHFILSYVPVEVDDVPDIMLMHRIDVVHPKTGKHFKDILEQYVFLELAPKDAFKGKLCDFSLDNKVKCDDCMRCIVPKNMPNGQFITTDDKWDAMIRGEYHFDNLTVI